MSIDESRPQKRSWWNVPGHVYDKIWTPEGRVQIGLYAGVVMVSISTYGLIVNAFAPRDVTPEGQRFGWNEKLAKSEVPKIAASLPRFAITDTDGRPVTGAGQSAELWKFGQLANDGMHIPTWKQESGDCVSMGWSNAIAYRMAFQIAQEQRNEVLKIPFPPYMYGVSRVYIGKRQLGRGAGSVGAWAAQGSLSWGVLPADQAEELGFTYSGKLADKWGWEGPPKSATDFASRFRIRTIAQVKSWEDARDALVHGYPVTIASNVGFDGGSYDKDGKRWLRQRGNWGHQMCLIGVEDRAGRIKGAYCINSWGAEAHQKPLNGEPPGGFWMDAATVQRIVSQGDSWAYSDFDGFPAEAVANWNKFKARAFEQGEQSKQDAIEQVDSHSVQMEKQEMFAPSFVLMMLVVGVLTLGYFLKAKYSARARSVLTLGLVIAIIGMSASADAGWRRDQRLGFVSSGGCANGQCTPSSICVGGNCTAPGANCVNGVCRPPAVAPAKKVETFDFQVQLASNEAPVKAVWNAFESRAAVQSKPPQAWNAMAPSHAHLRSYRECYDTEKDFILVVGLKEAAERQLIIAKKPVAFELSLKGVDAGQYHVYDKNGLKIESLSLGRLVSHSKIKHLGQ